MSERREREGRATPRWVRALAPAKVNPWLEVLARRADGYHELDTALLALELADRVAVRARAEPGVALRVFGEHATADVPADERNLAWRAAAAVLDAARAADAERAPRGLELELEKRVPSCAGLGGGSSDAAAACLAAEVAVGRALGTQARSALLAALGSDCAFFAEAAATGFARCTGRGERVRPLSAPSRAWTILVLVPDVGASTGAVYRALEFPLSAPERPHSFGDTLFEKTEAELRLGLFNRLESAAPTVVPALARWRDLLDRFEGVALRLSGSGSAFFGVFRDPDAARDVLEEATARAQGEGLGLRGAWLTRPAGHGARIEP